MHIRIRTRFPEIMKARGLNGNSLVKMGMSQCSAYRVARGTSNLTLATVEKAANLLGISIFDALTQEFVVVPDGHLTPPVN